MGASMNFESLVLVYFIIAMNFLINRLDSFSCNLHKVLMSSMWIKHVFNLVMTFFVIVIFTRNNPIKPIILIAFTLIIYALFMLITRCDYRFLAVFMIIMTGLMYLEAERAYVVHVQTQKNKEDIDDDDAAEIAKEIQSVQCGLQIVSLVIVLLGVVVYIGQHSREYGKDWSWKLFWLGVSTCKGGELDTAHVDSNIVNDFLGGLVKLCQCI